MTVGTPEQAKEWLCPVSRTFGVAKAIPHCQGPSCAAWRWEKITTAHPLYRDAVRKAAEEIDDKPPYAKAARIVADDLEGHGLTVERGYCGLGGPV